MNIRRFLPRTALLLPVLLPACAAVTSPVTVSTSPPGAACAVDRAGTRLGVIPQTPGSLRVRTGGDELTVTCSKAGFQTAVVTARPGTDRRYPSDIRLDLAGSPGYGPPYAGHDLRPGYPARYGLPASVLPDPVAAHAASY